MSDLMPDWDDAWDAWDMMPGLGLTSGGGALRNLGLLNPGGRALGWMGTGSCRPRTRDIHLSPYFRASRGRHCMCHALRSAFEQFRQYRNPEGCSSACHFPACSELKQQESMSLL